MFTSFKRPFLYHSFSKICTVDLVEGRTTGCVNSLTWCKSESVGTILCQEAGLTFRRCKIPIPHQLSVMPPLKCFSLYTCILTGLLFCFFITFISMNLIVFDFVIVNIALMMQSSLSFVILYYFIYIQVASCILVLTLQQFLLSSVCCLGMCVTDLAADGH